MAASTNLDQIGVQRIDVPDFNGGINTATPPTEIQDNEFQDSLNYEFDNNGNLSTRRGVTELFSTTFGRITSLHYFSADSGEVGILFTEGTKLRIVQTNGTGHTDLTGGLTLPNDKFWQWVTFGGLAIGVNKATSGDNPVKVSTAPTAAALGGSPPKGKYITTWNNRVWIASASTPNQLKASALGLPEDWTATGAAGAITLDIEPNDGDLITGLFSTRETLYVFKRKRIFAITASALPNTDPNNLRVDVYARNIGCASPYSIQEVVDDVLFLSDQGIASLSLVATAEDFRTAFYSRNVAELERFPKTTEEIPSFLFDTAAQYWISLPSSVAPTAKPDVYVLDYLKLNEQLIRWTRFDGLVAGTAFSSFPSASSGKVYLIGADSNGAGAYKIYTYKPRDTTATFSDNGVAYNKLWISKSFNAGVQLINKFWHRWGMSLNLLSASAGIIIGYKFNGDANRGDSYSLGLTGTATATIWAAGVWAPGVWGTTFSGLVDIVRDTKSNQFGREAQDITFTLQNAQNGEGFTLQDFELYYAPLNERRVSGV